MVEASALLEKVALATGGVKEKILVKGVSEHLKASLLKVDAEIAELCSRHGVSSSKDMEGKYVLGRLGEEDTWRVFFKLSHLEELRETLEKLLEEDYVELLLNRKEAYRIICRAAETSYADIVHEASFNNDYARIFLKDGSFLEVWLYRDGGLTERHAFHWERTSVDGKIFRHDNMPHRKWGRVETFPKHFHQGAEWNVVESHIPDEPLTAAEYFLNFARIFLRKG